MEINDEFICSCTGKVYDPGWCNVMVDVVNECIKPTVMPDEYIQHEDFRERCKKCPVYRDFIGE